MELLGTGVWFVALGVMLCVDFIAYASCRPFTKYVLTGIEFYRATTDLCLVKCFLALVWGMFGVWTQTIFPLICAGVCVLYAFVELGIMAVELQIMAGPPPKSKQNPPRA